MPGTDIPKLFSQFFEPYRSTSPATWNQFAELFDLHQWKKNTPLAPDHIYFVLKGCVAGYIENESQQKCIDLSFEGEFAGDYARLLLKKSVYDAPQVTPDFRTAMMEAIPNMQLVALEDSELLCASSLAVASLLDSKDQQEVRFTIAEVLFLYSQFRFSSFLTLPAAERYKELLVQREDQLSRLPQQVIASYLGVTPESFSRIKQQLGTF